MLSQTGSRTVELGRGLRQAYWLTRIPQRPRLGVIDLPEEIARLSLRFVHQLLSIDGHTSRHAGFLQGVHHLVRLLLSGPGSDMVV